MKKLLLIAALLLVIFVSVVFSWARWQASGAEGNYFNRNLRERVAAHPFLREVLGLHWDGDARADYLGSRYSKILIEVDLIDGLDPDFRALDLLTEKISAAARKPASYIISDRNIFYAPQVSKDDIQTLAARHRNHRSSGDTATLYLLYVSRDAEKDSSLGSTYMDYGIVLYRDRLAEFAAAAPRTLPSYIASTALHEFGHQVGLLHNAEPGCLMNESAEQAHVARERVEDVIIDFCGYEITKLYESTK